MLKVILAYSRKVNGRNRKAGSTVTLDGPTARNLIHQGLARRVNEPEANIKTDEVEVTETSENSQEKETI